MLISYVISYVKKSLLQLGFLINQVFWLIWDYNLVVVFYIYENIFYRGRKWNNKTLFKKTKWLIFLSVSLARFYSKLRELADSIFFSFFDCNYGLLSWHKRLDKQQKEKKSYC